MNTSPRNRFGKGLVGLSTLVMLAGSTAHSIPGYRVTRNPKLIQQARLELDLIQACDGQKGCQVEILPGQQLVVNATNIVSMREPDDQDYPTSGLFGLSIDESKKPLQLPANPCITSPHPITAVYVRSHAKGKQYLPGKLMKSDDGQKVTLTGVVHARGNNAFVATGGAKTVCVSPPEQHKFAVVSVVLDVNTSLGRSEISFADNMIGATSILGDRVQEILEHSVVLLREPNFRDPDSTLISGDFDNVMGLQIAAFRGLKAALAPRRSPLDYPSPSDRLSFLAAKVALRAWDIIGPRVAATDSKRIQKINKALAKKDIDAANLANIPQTFEQHLQLIEQDVLGIRRSFGISPSQENAGHLTGAVAEVLLTVLDRMDAQADLSDAKGGKKGVSRAQFRDWFAHQRDTLAAIRRLSRDLGDQAPETQAKLKELSQEWQSPEILDRIVALHKDVELREDLRVFLAFFETFKHIPLAVQAEFPNIENGLEGKDKDGEVLKSLVSVGDGSVRCQLDVEGEHCYVDLIRQCEDRSACSTKLSFNGHWVALTSSTGFVEVPKDTLECIGEAIPGESPSCGKEYSIHVATRVPYQDLINDLEQKDGKAIRLPANPRICSDLPIEKVVYFTDKAGKRFTRNVEGMLTGDVDQKSMPRMFPPHPSYGKLGQNCIQFYVSATESEVAVLSVRLKVELDKNRSKVVPEALSRAGDQLRLSLKGRIEAAELTNSVSGAKSSLVSSYVAALKNLEKALDKKLEGSGGFFSRMFGGESLKIPVTDPSIREASLDVYLKGLIFLSFAESKSGIMPGPISDVRSMLNELSRGFGYNRVLAGEGPARAIQGAVRFTAREAHTELAKLHPKVSTMAGGLRAYIASEPTAGPKTRAGAEAAEKMDAAFEKLLKAIASSPDYAKPTPGLFVYVLNPEITNEAQVILDQAAVFADSYSRAGGIWAAKAKEIEGVKKSVADTLGLIVSKQVDSKATNNHRLQPLFEAMHASVDEAQARMSIEWSDDKMRAAYGVVLQLQRLTRLSRAEGDQAASILLPDLYRQVESPAFQSFMNSARSVQLATTGVTGINLGLMMADSYSAIRELAERK